MRSADFLTAVGIGVSDLESAAAFYQRALGMRETRRIELPEMKEIILDHEGRNAVVLMHWTDGKPRAYRDHPVKLVFYVTDPVAMTEAIRAEGMEITREPTPVESMGGALIALGKDPDGYVIELIEAPARPAATARSETASA
jgi:lactoylglutathione lyase